MCNTVATRLRGLVVVSSMTCSVVYFNSKLFRLCPIKDFGFTCFSDVIIVQSNNYAMPQLLLSHLSGATTLFLLMLCSSCMETVPCKPSSLHPDAIFPPQQEVFVQLIEGMLCALILQQQ